jgi:enoyl-CoA hydratase/carnithine racemase
VISYDPIGNIGALRIDDGRANLIGTTALRQLQAALGALKDADAVVLLGRRSIFSAGLDIPEINGFDDSGRLAFFEHLHEVRAALFGLDRPLITLVRGSAVGAGASLACCGDVRIGTTGSGEIGFTEGRLGFPLPASARVIAQSVLGTATGQLALLRGETCGRDEAVRLGYFHHLVERDKAEELAVEEAERMAALSAGTAMIKAGLRRAGLEEMERDRAESHALMVATWRTAMHQPAMVDLATRLERIQNR